MQIVFLGTSSGVPTKNRNVSSVALELEPGGEIFLFDCGEGTQHQWLKIRQKMSRITKIFITHMHGDHIYGLPGFLATLSMNRHKSKVELYGPKELMKWLQATCDLSMLNLKMPLEFHEISGEQVLFEGERFQVSTTPIKHRLPANAYRVDERWETKNINGEKLQQVGVKEGPIYGRLKSEEYVDLEDGRRLLQKDYIKTQQFHRSFMYCTDTMFSENAVKLARHVDVLVHEATFSEDQAELALEKMHSTAKVAAEVAKLAGAKQLLLTHFSPRYGESNSESFKYIRKEAEAIFKQTFYAEDLQGWSIDECGSLVLE